MTAEILAAMITAVFSSGILFYIFEWRQRRRLAGANADKVSAEAHDIEAGADNKTLDGAYKLIAALQDELDRMRCEIEALKKSANRMDALVSRMRIYIGTLLHGINILTSQIKATGNEPKWQPPQAPEGLEE